MRTALILVSTILLVFTGFGRAAMAVPSLAVGPQYVTAHVYVAPKDMDRFVKSFIATFGGKATTKQLVNITPTPSTTEWQAVSTPVGALSVFGFTTPYPWPFGAERNGFLVSNFDAAVKAVRADGGGFLASPFEDPIGRDAVLQWPGGVNMQLYWHTKPPHFPALASVPENRVYVAPEQADAFIRAYLAFSQGKVIKDDRKAPGIEIGEPFNTFRRVLIDSGFGKTLVFATDGQMPYPWGRETTGYEVSDLDATILKAEARRRLR